MSFRRHQSFAINTNAYLDNRLTQFTNLPMYTDNLLVKKNTDICGNLTVGHDIKAQSFYASGNYYLDGYILVPAGTITVSAAINIPGGWIECNGSVVAINDFGDLYNAIQHTYQYDISYNRDYFFRLPDLRGRVAIGAGDNSDYGISNRNFGTKGGEEYHQLTVDELPSHNHGVSDPGHRHTYVNQEGDQGVNTLTTQNTAADQYDYNQNTGYSYTGISINNTGNNGYHNNMQPYIVLRYLIKY